MQAKHKVIDFLDRIESSKQNIIMEKRDIQLQIIYTVCHGTCRWFFAFSDIDTPVRFFQ